MGLSDILGSLSPGFGMLSGKGLFGGGSGGGLNGLAGSGLFGLLGLLLHHSGGANAPAAQAASAGAPGGMMPNMSAGIPSHLNTPDLGQVANSMPGMANKPNPFSALGSAMQSNAAPDPGVQLTPASFGMTQQGNGLQALLQQILGQ